MKQSTYTDAAGRKFAVLLPEMVPDSEARKGVRLGPPDLSSLELPTAIEVRLNNQLHGRGLITQIDLARRPDEVVAAIAAALKVDVQRIMALYAGADVAHE